MRSLSKELAKYKTLNKGGAAIRRVKLMAETFGIALMPVLGRAMLGDIHVTVEGVT